MYHEPFQRMSYFIFFYHLKVKAKGIFFLFHSKAIIKFDTHTHTHPHHVPPISNCHLQKKKEKSISDLIDLFDNIYFPLLLIHYLFERFPNKRSQKSKQFVCFLCSVKQDFNPFVFQKKHLIFQPLYYIAYLLVTRCK